MKRLHLLILFITCLSAACPTLCVKAQDGYRNPVLRGFNPDPSICRVGDDFYMTTSSFEYFPGLPIYHSKDLIHWRQIGHCLTRDSQLPLHGAAASGGLYAPSLRYRDGLFYVICTNVSSGGNFFCTATDPAGEWSDPVWVGVRSIDPDIFWDVDGKTHFVTQGNEGIRVTEIDIKTGATLAPERLVWGGMGGRYPEAPHIYSKDGFYYLLLGEGGTEYAHSATIGRSRNVYGPYEPCPLNPIIAHGNRRGQSSPIQGVGHADFVQAPDGSWWVVFLGFRVTEPSSYYHILGRETFLAPVDWPAGGWPQVNGNGVVSLDMRVPTLPQHTFEKTPARTDFDTEKLGLEWNFLRNPQRENYSLSQKKGYLRITPSTSTLNETNPVSFVGRRQTEHTFTATTLLDFHPSADSDEAGVTLIQNNTHHYDLALTRKGGKNIVQLRVRAGSLTYVAAERALSGDRALLRVKGSPLQYHFYVADPKNGEYAELGRMDTRYLSTEVAGGFTGVMIGLYASSNGKPSRAEAFYDWFDYQVDAADER